MSKTDPRYCPVCNKPLLRQNDHRLVLLIRCDQCGKVVHKDCYLEHHRREHDLIAIILEEPYIS